MALQDSSASFAADPLVVECLKAASLPADDAGEIAAKIRWDKASAEAGWRVGPGSGMFAAGGGWWLQRECRAQAGQSWSRL